VQAPGYMDSLVGMTGAEPAIPRHAKQSSY